MIHTSEPWERRRLAGFGSGQDGRDPRILQALEEVTHGHHQL
jgi:hypothetical protein